MAAARFMLGGVVALFLGLVVPLFLWGTAPPGSPLSVGVKGAALVWLGIAAFITGWSTALRMLPGGAMALHVASRATAQQAAQQPGRWVDGAHVVASVVGAIVALAGTVAGGALVVVALTSPEAAHARNAAEFVGWTGALALGMGTVCVVAVVRGARGHRRLQARPAAAPPSREGRPVDS